MTRGAPSRSRSILVRPAWAIALLLGLTGALALRNLAGVAGFALHRAGEGDFALYYIFARIGIDHGWASLYNLALQRQEWLALGSRFFYPALFPPMVAWFVAPFAVWPFPVAYAFWNALLGAALLTTWWLTAPASSLMARLTHLTFALALPAIAFGLLLGQLVVVVAAAVALSWYLLQKHHEVGAGLVLCLIALKPQLALVVPVALLVAGHWRVIAAWAAGSLAMLAVALATVGPNGLYIYGSRLLQASQAPGESLVYPQLTLPGLVGNALAGGIVSGLVAGGVLIVVWRRRKNGLAFPFVAGVCASMLVANYLHAQDVAVLLPAAWLWLRSGPVGIERVLGLAGFIATGVLTTPLPLLLAVAAWLLPSRSGVDDEAQPAGGALQPWPGRRPLRPDPYR